jgi:hypothetical protein
VLTAVASADDADFALALRATVPLSRLLCDLAGSMTLPCELVLVCLAPAIPNNEPRLLPRMLTADNSALILDLLLLAPKERIRHEDSADFAEAM